MIAKGRRKLAKYRRRKLQIQIQTPTPPLPIDASHTLPTPNGLFASPTPGYGHTKIPHPLSAAKDKQVSGAPDAHCALPNGTAHMGMPSSLPDASLPTLECGNADATSNSTAMTNPQRQLAFISTTPGPLPPGSPLLQPATTCAPQRTTGLAAANTLGLDDTCSPLDLASSTTALDFGTGAARMAPPLTAASATSNTFSLLPSGPPLLHPATSCAPQRNAGMAAGTVLGVVTSCDAVGRVIVCMALAQCARDAARDAVLPADYADFG